MPLFHHLSSFFVHSLKKPSFLLIHSIQFPTMSNPATTATKRPTQRRKVPKFFKGEKVAKHPDLMTVSIVLIVLFILFYVIRYLIRFLHFFRPVNSSLLRSSLSSLSKMSTGLIHLEINGRQQERQCMTSLVL